jgi:hypothetical protein
MDKAAYSVLTMLGLSVDDKGEFARLELILQASVMHTHFLPDVEWPGHGTPSPFPPSKTVTACPVCGSKFATSVKTGDDGQSEPSQELPVFACPFEGCNDSTSGWSDWDQLWRHQVKSGHVVCKELESLG